MIARREAYPTTTRFAGSRGLGGFPFCSSFFSFFSPLPKPTAARKAGCGRVSTGYLPGVANRRFHYDRAFEHYLRANAIPYIAVDEAKRALSAAGGHQTTRGRSDAIPDKLKSFDFVVYSKRHRNLLIDVKGRKHSGKTGKAFQNWVTRDDVACLSRWAQIFGDGFEPAFAFLFWCDAQPPDALFHEVFSYGDRWYAVLAVSLHDYQQHMRDRSAKWDTVSIPAKAFDELSQPLMELL